MREVLTADESGEFLAKELEWVSQEIADHTSGIESLTVTIQFDDREVLPRIFYHRHDAPHLCLLDILAATRPRQREH